MCWSSPRKYCEWKLGGHWMEIEWWAEIERPVDIEWKLSGHCVEMGLKFRGPWTLSGTRVESLVGGSRPILAQGILAQAFFWFTAFDKYHAPGFECRGFALCVSSVALRTSFARVVLQAWLFGGFVSQALGAQCLKFLPRAFWCVAFPLNGYN